MAAVFFVIHTLAKTPVSVWTPFEVTLSSTLTYSPPENWNGTIELDMEFHHLRTAQRFTTPGFWDGADVWRVRFSPPLVGDWQYISSCTDPRNPGLHNQNGTFSVVPYEGKNPLFLHGVIRPSVGGRFLEHADGTPFYWLGDTHWSGFSNAERWNTTSNNTIDTDPAGLGSMFKELVDVRAKQGYSVWKAETFIINGAQGIDARDGSNHDNSHLKKGDNPHHYVVNQGGPAWGANGGFLVDLNPTFWSAIDERVAYVNSKGIVVSLAFAGIGRGMADDSYEPQLKALARYTVARYAGYSTVWTTCQEYCACGNGSPSHYDARCSDAWMRVAKVQWELDPLQRSTSLHNCAWNPLPAWRGEEWYGHVTLQQGHFRTDGVAHWLSQYNAIPARPLIEDEANYELLDYASMKTAVPGWMTRQSAWQSQMGGAAGFTYGGQGIWWACPDRNYSNGNCGGTGSSPGFYTWDEALDFPVGGKQMGYMASFFRRLPWFRLEPDATAIVWNVTQSGTKLQESQLPAQKSCCKDGEGLDTIVAYLPQSQSHTSPAAQCRHGSARMYAGVVGGISPHWSHKASWFNPRTGKYTGITTIAQGVTTWEVPATRPDVPGAADQDWVFLLEPNYTSGNSTVGSIEAQNEVRSSANEVHGSVALARSNAQGTSWVTSTQAIGTIRKSASTNGCSFVTTSSSSLKIVSLCRFKIKGDINLDPIALYEVAAGAKGLGTLVANVTVDSRSAKSDVLGFVCAALPLVVSLKPSTRYVLASQNTGCDSFLDDMESTITTAGGAPAQVGSVYQGGAVWMPGGGGTGHCYGPMNFYYV